MEILVPEREGSKWESIIDQIKAAPPLLPFDEIILEFIAALSNQILKNHKYRKFPELIAMAYWLRKGHLQEIRTKYELKRQEKVWLPRGVVLHFAPSNVDTIFIYSMFLSMLVGNFNIVRISQKRGEQISLLIDLLAELLREKKFISIAERTLILSYEHNVSITQKLSDICDVRVIWGGDETIKTIRKTELPARATEMVFANRFSMTLIKADSLVHLTDKEVIQLANNFYNDAYWFDQMACSSPRMVIWVGSGDPDEVKARSRFWESVKDITVKKAHKWDPSVGMNRMVEGYTYASQGLVTQLSTIYSDDPYRATLEKFTPLVKENHCGGGFFFELVIKDLGQSVEFFDQRDQTLATFGFTEKELLDLAWSLGGKGIDRIVPIGKALDFHEVWDGYDFLTYLTREVVVQH